MRYNFPMRIATLNIHGGRDGVGTNRPSLPAVADLLRSVTPDVCLLQEVDRRLLRSGFADQAVVLAGALRTPALHFAFGGPLNLGIFGAFGNAILGRQPFAEVQRLTLPAAGGEPRGAVGVTLRGSGKPLVVWNTHLGLRTEWRTTQLTALADAVNADTAAGKAVIVGGDFNARLDEGEIVAFQQRTGLGVLSPDAPTYPANAPAHRIDLLWGSASVSAGDTGVIAAPESSDHCLVWADILTAP